MQGAGVEAAGWGEGLAVAWEEMVGSFPGSFQTGDQPESLGACLAHVPPWSQLSLLSLCDPDVNHYLGKLQEAPRKQRDLAETNTCHVIPT